MTSTTISPYTGTGVALVTGSARGIGKAIALRLAQDGFDAALNDLSSKTDQIKDVEKEIMAIGKRTVVTADVSNEDEVKQMIEKVVEVLGGLDVMVVNAGICTAAPMVETSTELWEQTFAVNSRSTFLCYKYATIQMIKQGRGDRIIGASSGAGKQGAKYLMAYSASNFAVRGMTQSAAWEAAKYGITVNAYAPGAIDTELARKIGEEFTKIEPFSAPVNISNTPAGRPGSPEEVAALVSFVASKDSSFITGQTLNVDGGWYFD
ncbi:hypothetical protein VNI00_012209 [Paramarasmius palmivorus]|uniref:Uncharacterized protein n=1 Tax=Paramarasmius palmivorus TaxID=297713 RepID=A0AAW0C4I1_9AGAR